MAITHNINHGYSVTKYRRQPRKRKSHNCCPRHLCALTVSPVRCPACHCGQARSGACPPSGAFIKKTAVLPANCGFTRQGFPDIIRLRGLLIDPKFLKQGERVMKKLFATGILAAAMILAGCGGQAGSGQNAADTARDISGAAAGADTGAAAGSDEAGSDTAAMGGESVRDAADNSAANGDAADNNAANSSDAGADGAQSPETADAPKNVLMVADDNAFIEAETPVFGSSYFRSDIRSIVFKDTLADMPEDAWDVSEAQDGSVMAWVAQDVLTIAGEGGVTANPDSSQLFNEYSQVTSIEFNDCFDTSYAQSMSFMFYHCPALTSLDLSSFDTSNVTAMNSMFANCEGLSDLNISSFDTSQTESMSGMFYNCKSITALDLSHFDTSRVTSMKEMFSDCHSLSDLNIRSFNTAQVTDMAAMFKNCEALKALDLSGFDFSHVERTRLMFSGCTSLESIGVDSLSLPAIQESDDMYTGTPLE